MCRVSFLRVVQLKPFDRLVIKCSVPVFKEELYQADYLCLLKYEADPLKVVRDAEINSSIGSSAVTMHMQRDTKSFVRKRMNAAVFGKDVVKWNAPSTFKGDPEDIAKLGFDGVRNFELKPIEADARQAALSDVEVTEVLSVLYAPSVHQPGKYTVRYCLDDLKVDATSWATIKAKDRLLSPKSYYYNRFDCI